MRLEPHPNHGRILAFAHFEAGNTEKALEWARGARDAAIRGGAAKLEMSLEQTLTQLENGYPCRQP